jgi:hypothetical protein
MDSRFRGNDGLVGKVLGECLIQPSLHGRLHLPRQSGRIQGQRRSQRRFEATICSSNKLISS